MRLTNKDSGNYLSPSGFSFKSTLNPYPEPYYRWINVGGRAELISNDDYNNLLPAVTDIVNTAIKDTFAVKRIHKSGPVTVVIWNDGTKTVVRRAEGSKDDPYAAFCAAVTKRIYGSNSKINKMLKVNTKENGKEKK